MIPPDAISIPLFMASDCPLSCWETHRICGYFSAYLLMTSTVPSVEPPSMMICSASGQFCAITFWMQNSMKRAPPSTGVMTERLQGMGRCLKKDV